MHYSKTNSIKSINFFFNFLFHKLGAEALSVSWTLLCSSVQC